MKKCIIGTVWHFLFERGLEGGVCEVNVILSKSDGKMGPMFRCIDVVKSHICVALLHRHGKFGNDVQTGRTESLGWRTIKILYVGNDFAYLHCRV